MLTSLVVTHHALAGPCIPTQQAQLGPLSSLHGLEQLQVSHSTRLPFDLCSHFLHLWQMLEYRGKQHDLGEKVVKYHVEVEITEALVPLSPPQCPHLETGGKGSCPHLSCMWAIRLSQQFLSFMNFPCPLHLLSLGVSPKVTRS